MNKWVLRIYFINAKPKKPINLREKSNNEQAMTKCWLSEKAQKTEPYYFTELVEYYKINSANVAIDGSCDSSPKSVLQRAIALYNAEDKKGDAFDRVYCVFDKDSHETYQQTIDSINKKRPTNTFFAAISIPCFEYWLLLHFNFTTKPYEATGKHSIAETVIKDLKNYLPLYDKGQNGLFQELVTQLPLATANAVRVVKQAAQNHSDNPSTIIHELVSYLQSFTTNKE